MSKRSTPAERPATGLRACALSSSWIYILSRSLTSPAFKITGHLDRFAELDSVTRVVDWAAQDWAIGIAKDVPEISPRLSATTRGGHTARKHLGIGRQSWYLNPLDQIAGRPSIQLALKLQFESVGWPKHLYFLTISTCFRPKKRASKDQAPGPIIAKLAPKPERIIAVHR